MIGLLQPLVLLLRTGFNHIDILIHHDVIKFHAVLFSIVFRSTSSSICVLLFLVENFFLFSCLGDITKLFSSKKWKYYRNSFLNTFFRVTETATTTTNKQTNKENNMEKEKLDINFLYGNHIFLDIYRIYGTLKKKHFYRSLTVQITTKVLIFICFDNM